MQNKILAVLAIVLISACAGSKSTGEMSEADQRKAAQKMLAAHKMDAYLWYSQSQECDRIYDITYQSVVLDAQANGGMNQKVFLVQLDGVVNDLSPYYQLQLLSGKGKDQKGELWAQYLESNQLRLQPGFSTFYQRVMEEGGVVYFYAPGRTISDIDNLLPLFPKEFPLTPEQFVVGSPEDMEAILNPLMQQGIHYVLADQMEPIFQGMKVVGKGTSSQTKVFIFPNPLRLDKLVPQRGNSVEIQKMKESAVKKMEDQ